MQQKAASSERSNEFALPKFIEKNADGISVNLAKLDSGNQFESFVESVFASRHYFKNIVYERFAELLYEYPQDRISAECKKGAARVKFAADIAELPPERLALYRPPKEEQGMAEYFFEPVMVENNETNRLEKTSLSFDEFVAAMWMKGIRFGIEHESVKKIIQSGEIARLVFARSTEPLLGTDSGLKEVCNSLYRDDAPRAKADGRVDLRQFQNRFPQIKKGVRLLQKTPRSLGLIGRKISGEPVEPPLPQDFDLLELAGPGTKVEVGKEGEFIVSTIDGFLNIDDKTNQITVTEKIVNRTGVSARTTGDLSISANEYEELGEIQEKRVLEGKNITVHSNVYGQVLSTGGIILLKQGLIGGKAANQDGDIEIEGLVSRATVHAMLGTVRLKKAENSLIVGKHVMCESAVNCDIVAEKLELASAHGCTIAGKSIRVEEAHQRKDHETSISLLIPDLSAIDEEIAELRKKREEFTPEIAKKKHEIDEIAAKKDVATYRTVSKKLEKKEITLTDEQKIQWQKMAAAVAPSLKMIVKLSHEAKVLKAQAAEIDEKIAEREAAKIESATGISCYVEIPHSSTIVRPMRYEMAELYTLSAQDLKAKIRDPRLLGERLNREKGASFSWQYQLPGEPA